MAEENEGCGCITAVVYWIVGTILFDYSLWAWFGKDVPWYVDLIGGFLLGWLSVPFAFVAWCIGPPFPIFVR